MAINDQLEKLREDGATTGPRGAERIKIALTSGEKLKGTDVERRFQLRAQFASLQGKDGLAGARFGHPDLKNKSITIDIPIGDFEKAEASIKSSGMTFVFNTSELRRSAPVNAK